MKVGILTFHRALNYGAVLQAYALKTVIAEKGHNAEVVDYRNEVIESLYDYPGFFKHKGLKNKIKYLVYSRKERLQRARFEEFRKNYLGLVDSRIYTKDNISEANKNYDTFLVGSDQVWNPDAHDFDDNFFLSFASEKRKRHSYAASFGVESIDAKHFEKCKDLVSGFSVCSVRETQGIDVLNSLGKTEARVDLDPSLLLDKTNWQRNLNLAEPKEKYVLLYSFALTNRQKDMLRYCYKMGYKVKMIGKTLKNPFDFPCEFVSAVSPVDFVQLFYGASFVVTNSFHGTAFAINFCKPLAVELLPSGSKVNSRLVNILSLVSLDNRLLSDSISCEQIYNNSIDWECVKSKLQEMRASSIKYLEECLDD